MLGMVLRDVKGLIGGLEEVGTRARAAAQASGFWALPTRWLCTSVRGPGAPGWAGLTQRVISKEYMNMYWLAAQGIF